MLCGSTSAGMPGSGASLAGAAAAFGVGWAEAVLSAVLDGDEQLSIVVIDAASITAPAIAALLVNIEYLDRSLREPILRCSVRRVCDCPATTRQFPCQLAQRRVCRSADNGR
jgi:hypothetical protein